MAADFEVGVLRKERLNENRENVEYETMAAGGAGEEESSGLGCLLGFVQPRAESFESSRASVWSGPSPAKRLGVPRAQLQIAVTFLILLRFLADCVFLKRDTMKKIPSNRKKKLIFSTADAGVPP